MDLLPILSVTAGAFLAAGFVKGVIGLGLPTVAIGLLGLLMTPAQAAAILVVPSLVTNIWQFVVGGDLLALVRRMWPMLIGICVGTDRRDRAATRQQRPVDRLAWDCAYALCRAGIDQDSVLGSATRGDLAGIADGDGDRCDHGGDRHIRLAGDAVCASLAIRARPDGAGARLVIHGLHRHGLPPR